LTQSTHLPDERREYRVGKQVWAPANSDGQFRGQVTARLALEQSINTATVALGMGSASITSPGWPSSSAFRSTCPTNPSMLLGAVETSPVRLAGAYATFANGGYRVTPHALNQVQVGDEVFRPERPQPRRVVSSSGAYLVTDMLVGALQHGTGASASRLGFHHVAAGKTGTSDQARDTWFVGYTPDCAPRCGSATTTMRPPDVGASAALPVWVATMSPWLGSSIDSQFDIPPGIASGRSIRSPAGSRTARARHRAGALRRRHRAAGVCNLHSPSFADRWDRLFGDDDGAQPPTAAPAVQARLLASGEVGVRRLTHRTTNPIDAG
jgi:membrane peptidoglycan carboxypeptidase